MHNGRMSLKALRTFEAVVRNRSMAKAADELYVSAGAVGFQIRALEAELGFRLFDRVGGEMLPTEAAVEVSRQIRGGFEQVFGGSAKAELRLDLIRQLERMGGLLGAFGGADENFPFAR